MAAKPHTKPTESISGRHAPGPPDRGNDGPLTQGHARESSPDRDATSPSARNESPVARSGSGSVPGGPHGNGNEEPDILRPGDPSRGERWAALYTRARQEKRLARACEYLEIRHYLPLYEHQTGTKRRRTYYLPLFSGYVFACLDPDSRLEILRANRVVRTLWPEQERLLLYELRQVRQALDASADLIIGPSMAKGDLVRLTRGPLKGVEGVVCGRMRRRGRGRLVLNVSLLGRSVATEVDLADVERVRRVMPVPVSGVAEELIC